MLWQFIFVVSQLELTLELVLLVVLGCLVNILLNCIVVSVCVSTHLLIYAARNYEASNAA